MNSLSFFTPVQVELQEVEDRLCSQASDVHPLLKDTLVHLLTSGGKRIRPALGLLTGKMLGAPHDEMITLASAVELLHTATLVHDDLIDGSLMRRGVPTLNSLWSPPATVLTGDFLFARAAGLAAESNHLPLMKLFAETLAIIVSGELTQMFISRGLASREIYYKRIYAKTASLIELTTRTSAMVSPVDDSVVEAMGLFGYNLGMAFQIVDDVLDFTGEQAEVGKPVGSDLLQGLVTLPTIYYAEAHPDDPNILCLSSGCFTDHVLMEKLIATVSSSDSVEKSLDEAQGFINQALEILQGMKDGEARRALEDMARYIVHRKI